MECGIRNAECGIKGKKQRHTSELGMRNAETRELRSECGMLNAETRDLKTDNRRFRIRNGEWGMRN